MAMSADGGAETAGRWPRLWRTGPALADALARGAARWIGRRSRARADTTRPPGATARVSDALGRSLIDSGAHRRGSRRACAWRRPPASTDLAAARPGARAGSGPAPWTPGLWRSTRGPRRIAVLGARRAIRRSATRCFQLMHPQSPPGHCRLPLRARVAEPRRPGSVAPPRSAASADMDAAVKERRDRHAATEPARSTSSLISELENGRPLGRRARTST